MISSPARSKERGDDGHVSLALAAAVVGEVILCGIVILRIACEVCKHSLWTADY